MNELVDGFVSYLTAAGKSIHTVNAYKLDIDGFVKYLEDTGKELKELRHADLIVWTGYMEKQGLSAATRSRKISTVKSFFRYLLKIEYIIRNPTEGLEKPKLSKKAPKVISTDSAKDLLLHSYWSDEKDNIKFRNYTIIAMFLFTGIRREELSNIKLSDIDKSGKTILIHGKGDKERTVYVNDSLYLIIQEYINGHRGRLKCATDSEYLFVSTKGEKLAVNSINNVVNKIMESVGIKEKGISAHILRKRFATTAFDNTRDIATVSKLLGHSSPTVTMRYVSIDERTLRNVTSAVHF